MVVFSAGDTAWVLICTLLVLLMSIPAVAFFYGGLSKRKNVLNTIEKKRFSKILKLKFQKIKYL